jgi:hypothetical protein
MLDAGLNGHELAARCDWSAAKTSRIIHGKTPASDADIRAWCAACGKEEQVPDLIAANRAADTAYVHWRRLHRTGMRRAQDEIVPLFERTKLFRVYCSNVIPGMLQTAGYATALMSAITEFQGTPDDVAEAVEARLARSHVIRDGDHRFALLIEESVLRYRVGDAETMAGQLGFLLEAMTLPRISLGIVPFTAHRRIWPLEAFTIFDDSEAQVELLAAKVTVTQASEIATYVRAFTDLANMAVVGAHARARITAAIDALD